MSEPFRNHVGNHGNWLGCYDSQWCMTDFGPSPFPSMERIQVSTNGVTKLLKKINPHKATGPDNIPACLLKELQLADSLTALVPCYLSYARPLCTLEISLKYGSQPQMLQSSKKVIETSRLTTDLYHSQPSAQVARTCYPQLWYSGGTPLNNPPIETYANFRCLRSYFDPM